MVRQNYGTEWHTICHTRWAVYCLWSAFHIICCFLSALELLYLCRLISTTVYGLLPRAFVATGMQCTFFCSISTLVIFWLRNAPELLLFTIFIINNYVWFVASDFCRTRYASHVLSLIQAYIHTLESSMLCSENEDADGRCILLKQNQTCM